LDIVEEHPTKIKRPEHQQHEDWQRNGQLDQTLATLGIAPTPSMNCHPDLLDEFVASMATPPIRPRIGPFWGGLFV
jgi:hypothetical protein